MNFYHFIPVYKYINQYIEIKYALLTFSLICLYNELLIELTFISLA